MPGLWAQLKRLNSSLTLNQKLSITALGTVILCGILFFAYLLQRSPYQLLFSDLDAENASSVTQRLQQMNIPYRLEEGGRSILVPAERLDEARLQLAGERLPSVGRLGMELFDQNNWGVTDFAERVNYRRALEGELERTILTLNEVDRARVHLVLPKDALFEEDRQVAKASVVLRLTSPGVLDSRKVAAIQNLVAFAVEGLDPGNVTVVDVNGNLLSDRSPADDALTAAQVGLQRKIEKELCQKVIAILEPVVGEDSVRVSASVRLDVSERKETQQQVQDPVVISEQVSRESVNQRSAAGIPFRANDPSAEQQNAGGREVVGPERTLENQTTNYEVSRTVREIVVPGGSILHQSVAVVVNYKDVENPDGEIVLEPRSEEEMERIRKLVSATVGFSADRGDVLTVENVPFSGLPEQLQFAPVSFWERNRDLIYIVSRYLLILALFVLFYLVIFRPVRNKVFSYVEVERSPRAALAGMVDNPELLKQLEQALAEGKPLLPGETAERESPYRKDVLKLAKEDPQALVHLIRSWLSEGA